MRRLFLIVVASLGLVFQVGAQPATDNFDALRASGEITDLLARRDIDGAAQAAARLTAGTPADKLKDAFQIISDLGQGQYTDLVYAHDWGRTEKDIIFKVNFAKSFLFVRYLYHVDNGAWRLIRIHLAKEDELPFPKAWVHIYPK